MSSSAEPGQRGLGADVAALPSYEPGPDAEPDENWYGRRGRLSPQRVRDFTRLYARYGLADPAAVAAWQPDVLEIGFGAGESVLGLAAVDRTSRVLGVEPFAPGVLALMRGLAESGTENVRVTRTNVVAVLPEVPAGSLALVRAFFPDPWPKRRHAARRLVREPLVNRVVALLAPGGVLHVATDIDAYAAEVRAVAGRHAVLVPTEPPPRAATRYEATARRAGRTVHDLAWRKSG